MDKLTHIKKLLSAFYEGNTTLSEEKELETFFSKANVPEELLADKELFLSIAASTEPVEVPADLNEQIIQTIDKAQHREVRLRRINLYSISGLAAGLLIIFSVYLGFIRESRVDVATQFAIEDPQEAYKETVKALEFISEKWNEGTSELKNLNEVNKTMKTMAPITKITSATKELNLLGNLKKAEKITLQ